MFNSILLNFIDGLFGIRKKTAFEYRGYHQAFILILLEYMGILYISYGETKGGLSGLVLGWGWCFVWYKFISPIPIGVRYFHKFGMYIPKEIFNKEKGIDTVFFIKELFELIIVMVFYRLLWVSLFGNEYYKNMVSFVWITHILITTYIYQKEETTIYLHKRWKEQEKYEADVVT